MFTSAQLQVPSPIRERARVRGLRNLVPLIFMHSVFSCSSVCSSFSSSTVYATDFSAARRLGISLTALQKSLEKVGGLVTFTSRSGSSKGTQEARLPDNSRHRTSRWGQRESDGGGTVASG